ncbi:MAG TPA: FKBP-type peptidyl-prolyl cis-trans isomerase [Microthrixaceae bacterium]|nr:FKBP-type peptidyl-prolyl cis-trans isomerase [Microthrixaceae bacterium]
MQGRKWLLRVSGASVLALALVVVGCSSSGDDAAADKGKTEASDSLNSEASSDFSTVVADRGEPKLTAVEVPADLKITDDVVGTGRTVKATDTVTVHYIGAAASTGKVFESSWDSQPATFPLDQVIEGWSKGLVGMKEGGRRTLVIPAALAYGNGGPAPGDALVFTVDMIKIG